MSSRLISSIKSESIQSLTVFMLILACMLPVTSVQADKLVFTAAPRESAAKGQKLYGPVVDYISKVTGRATEYYNPGYWLRYQSDIKKFKYDFVFDGPHLASWRIKNIKHKPLVKLPGYLQFYFIARKNDRKVKVPTDLIYKKVCVIAPPNLTAVMLLNKLNDPVREPFLVSVKGGMGAIVKKLLAGGCSGAVVRSNFYDVKLKPELRDELKVIYTTEQLPNQVITVSDRISAEDRQKLVEALLSEAGKKALAPVIKRFGGKNVDSFVKAEEHEYDGYSSFLEGVVLGW